MHFINLHAHSNYSDGQDSLEAHMFAQVKLGFSAVVLTDHIYINDMGFTLSKEKFLAQCEEARQLEDTYGTPFIIGAEVQVMKMEEICIFGKEALLEIFRIKKKGIVNYNDLVYLKENYSCVMNLCHPMNPGPFVRAGAMDFLDGYEFIHSGEESFDSTFPVPDEFNDICPLANSDAHALMMLEWSFNKTEIALSTEESLIEYEKARRTFEHMVFKPTQEQVDASWG